MEEKVQLSILIPVFNENQTIVKTLKNILSVAKYEYKILICYDYDEDPSVKIIKENFPNNMKIVFIKNFSRGFNNALISGIKNANSEAIIFYMADDHINHNVINFCYEKFLQKNQLVCPSRFIRGGKMIGNPFFKSFLTRCASFFLYYFTSFPIKDSTNSFRLFPKDLFDKVNIESNKGFTLSLELTAKAHRLGYKIIEIPTTWIERDKGKSRFKVISFILPYLKWLFYIINTSIFYRNAK